MAQSTTKENIEKTIRNILSEENIRVNRLILFGSRVRGNYNEMSDWDVLVVVDRDQTFPEKHTLTTKIQRELAKLKIPNDIIIKSERQFKEMKDLTGSIVYYAHKEGSIL